MPFALFAPPALCMLSFSIVPSKSFAPNSCATIAKFKPIVAQYALICGTLSSTKRDIAMVLRISSLSTCCFTGKKLLSFCQTSGIKACYILQSPQPQDMLHSVSWCFNMPKKHCGVALSSFFVPQLVDFEPILTAYLALANLSANLLIKNFSTPARHRIHAVFYHFFYTFFIRKPPTPF